MAPPTGALPLQEAHSWLICAAKTYLTDFCGIMAQTPEEESLICPYISRHVRATRHNRVKSEGT